MLRRIILRQILYILPKQLQLYMHITHVRELTVLLQQNLWVTLQKDAGAQMKYANNGSSQMFDYLSDAKVAGGNHTFNMIFIDGQWIPCDACPTP